MPKAKQALKKLETPKTWDQVKALIDRTNVINPNQADIELLQHTLTETSDRSLWRECGDVLLQARRGYLETLDASHVARETAKLRCDQMQKELANEGDGPLERLLIDQVIFAWLRLSQIEAKYTQIWTTPGGVTFDQGLFWEKRLTAAHKRFDQATVALARVRKLLQGVKVKNLNVAVFNPPNPMMIP